MNFYLEKATLCSENAVDHLHQAWRTQKSVFLQLRSNLAKPCVCVITTFMPKLQVHIWQKNVTKIFGSVTPVPRSFSMRVFTKWLEEGEEAFLRVFLWKIKTSKEEVINVKREPKLRIVPLQPLAYMCRCVTQFSFPSQTRSASHRLHDAQISVAPLKKMDF